MNPINPIEPNVNPFCEGVLIIDDEPDIRESLQQYLELVEISAEIAANGQEGLKVLSNLPLPQLILLDLMMPVMDGWTFAETIKTLPHLSQCPVVIMSAFADRAKSIPHHGLLPKPIRFEKMTALIERFVKKRDSVGVE